MRRGTHERGRPVVLAPEERAQLIRIAANLERRGFKADASLLAEIGAAWDQMGPFVVVHQAAVAGRADPEGVAA